MDRMSIDIEHWQKVIGYYRACVFSENTADAKFQTTNDGKDFFLVKEEECISSGNSNLVVDGRKPKFSCFIQSTRWNTAPLKYFYGFPCHVDSGGIVHPLIIFDVELDQQANIYSFALQSDKPRLNVSGLGFGVTAEVRKQAIDVFNQTWDGGRALIDNVDDVLRELEVIFPHLSRHTLLHNPFGVLFHSIQSPFTRGLEEELAKLARDSEPPNRVWQMILDRNSLPEEEDRQDILEITSLNDEQRRAVKSAFVNPLTIVTGPPGTGKSQVILNVIANALRHNETILFGSKNNRAVDVVVERLLESQSVPIVLRYGNDELGFVESMLQAVEYATSQNGAAIENGVREYEDQLVLARREERQAKQTLDRILDRRNRIEEVENLLESLKA